MDDYIVHILTVKQEIYQCTHRDITIASSVDEVIMKFTSDILSLNEHYLGIIEVQNQMGSRNGSGIYFSKY